MNSGVNCPKLGKDAIEAVSPWLGRQPSRILYLRIVLGRAGW
jgi:hypothetical protein